MEEEKKFWRKFSSTRDKVILVVSTITLLESGYIGYKSWLESEIEKEVDSIKTEFSEFKRQMLIYKNVAKGETDIDVNLLKKHGLEVYHCNRNKYGEYKYSFLDYKAVSYEVNKSRSKGVWEYKDKNGAWHPIINVKTSE